MPRPTTKPTKGKKPKEAPAIVCHLQEDEETGAPFYKLHRVLARNVDRWMDNHPDDEYPVDGVCPPAPEPTPEPAPTPTP